MGCNVNETVEDICITMNPSDVPPFWVYQPNSSLSAVHIYVTCLVHFARGVGILYASVFYKTSIYKNNSIHKIKKEVETM